MPVYMIIEIKAFDNGMYSEYVKKVKPLVEKHGGRYLARGGKVSPFEGGWDPGRIIVIEFDSMEKWEKCFKSPEYRKIAPLREKSVETRAIVVEGC
jgi:uncharacterized protein (DUF1330 family)